MKVKLIQAKQNPTYNDVFSLSTFTTTTSATGAFLKIFSLILFITNTDISTKVHLQDVIDRSNDASDPHHKIILIMIAIINGSRNACFSFLKALPFACTNRLLYFYSA